MKKNFCILIILWMIVVVHSFAGDTGSNLPVREILPAYSNIFDDR